MITLIMLDPEEDSPPVGIPPPLKLVPLIESANFSIITV